MNMFQLSRELTSMDAENWSSTSCKFSSAVNLLGTYCSLASRYDKSVVLSKYLSHERGKTIFFKKNLHAPYTWSSQPCVFLHSFLLPLVC